MPQSKLRHLSLVAAALMAVSFAPIASAATITFTNDFTSTGFTNQSNFTLNTTAPGTLTSTFSGSTTGYLARGTEQFSNAANNTFTLRTEFQITAMSADPQGDNTVGFGLFASDSSLSGGVSNPFLLADWTFLTNTSSNQGRLRLLQVGSPVVQQGSLGTADDNGSSTQRAAILNKTYELVLEVTNTASNTYDLSLSLFDGEIQVGSSASVTSYNPVAEPSGGYYMGIRSRYTQFSGTTTASFDNFTAIPEPSSALLIGFSTLALLRRRRC